MQRDAHVTVLAGLGGVYALASLGDVFAEGEGDQGGGFADVRADGAGWAAGASPGYPWGLC